MIKYEELFHIQLKDYKDRDVVLFVYRLSVNDEYVFGYLSVLTHLMDGKEFRVLQYEFSINNIRELVTNTIRMCSDFNVNDYYLIVYEFAKILIEENMI